MENCHTCIRNKKTVTMVFHSTLDLYELSLDYIINHALLESKKCSESC